MSVMQQGLIIDGKMEHGGGNAGIDVIYSLIKWG